MNQALLDRAKKDGVILVFHSYMWEHGDKLESYGEKRLADDSRVSHRDRYGNPCRRAFRFDRLSGRPAAAHSGHGDAQGSNGKVYGGNQRVRRDEAIKSVDAGWRVCDVRGENKGSITPGKLADFVVLRKDPRKVAPDTIKDIVIDSTYVGGKPAWRTATAAGADDQAGPKH